MKKSLKKSARREEISELLISSQLSRIHTTMHRIAIFFCTHDQISVFYSYSSFCIRNFIASLFDYFWSEELRLFLQTTFIREEVLTKHHKRLATINSYCCRANSSTSMFENFKTKRTSVNVQTNDFFFSVVVCCRLKAVFFFSLFLIILAHERLVQKKPPLSQK